MKPTRSIAATLLSAPIKFYRLFLSPLLPQACRFEPSCSRYALEAIAVHGAGRGFLLTVKRLSHCHPISWLGGSSGFDPVPPSHKTPSNQDNSSQPSLHKACIHER